MGRHSKPDEAPTVKGLVPVAEMAHKRRPEPVAIAAAAQAVLAAAVAIGWITWDDTTVSTVATAAGVIATVVIALVARSKVTPVSDPKRQ